MSHPFPPLAPQMPIRNRYRLPFFQPAASPVRVMSRGLPQISLPWLEIGLAVAGLLMLRYS